jgi:hypothetical protein
MTQEESFRLSGYANERIRRIFLNSGIDYRHFCFDGSGALVGDGRCVPVALRGVTTITTRDAVPGVREIRP